MRRGQGEKRYAQAVVERAGRARNQRMQAATDADAASTERVTPHTEWCREVSPAPTLESNPQPDPMQLNCSVVITVIDCLM